MKLLGNLFGGKRMAALPEGALAPDFTLSAMDGSQFHLRKALERGPVLAAFFKVSCPVCQYAFPFLDRIYRVYGKHVSIVGISQNEAKDTAAFIKEFGIAFPMLLDDTEAYPASNAYGLTNVPSLFWIAQGGKIEISCVGWTRKDIDAMNRRAAEAGQQGLQPVFRPEEQIADFRAG